MGQQRHLSTEAIILKTSICSEINKNLIFISPTLGIQQATAFGAAKIKSKFCSAVQAFTRVNLFLYKSPKTEFYKLEDINNIYNNDYITKDLNNFYLASFFNEVLINSYLSNEEFKSYYFLLLYSLELLKEKNNIKKTFIFFVSKFLFLSGYNFNLTECMKCKNKFKKYYFDNKKGGVLCEDHAKLKHFILTQNTASLWKKFLEDKYITLKDLKIDYNDCKQLYPIMIYLITNIFEKKLNTINFIKKIINQ